jgi:hypothetical protein
MFYETKITKIEERLDILALFQGRTGNRRTLPSGRQPDGAPAETCDYSIAGIQAPRLESLLFLRYYRVFRYYRAYGGFAS